jgi:hypothetical protein
MMSAGTIPEFKFPKSMFFPRLGLPNESHPWFDKFKADAKQSVFHPVTQVMMEYLASLSILEGLRDLEKETMLTVRATLRGGLRHLTEWKSKVN